MVLLTEIVVAVSISTIFLGEVLTVASSFGAIFIIVAMLLVSQADHSENKASTTVESNVDYRISSLACSFVSDC